MKRTTFLDFGARKGESLEWYVNKRRDLDDARIVFFEPCHSHLEDLRKIQAEDHREIEIVERAVWINNDFLKFDIFENDLANSVTPNPKDIEQVLGSEVVQGIDVARVVHKYRADRLIVKMDIEGAEVEVLRRLWKTGKLHDIDELLVEYHNFRGAREIAKVKQFTKPHRFQGIHLMWNY